MEKEKLSRRRFLGKSALVIATGVAAGVGVRLGKGAIDAGMLDSSIPIVIDRGNGFEKVSVPVYHALRLKPGRCSAYVRMAADDLFGKKYSLCNAWDRIYNDKLVCPVHDNCDLRWLYEKGILKPGMVLGVNYPESSHVNDVDMTGEKVKYTHNMLFLGNTPEDKIVFAEQFGSNIRTRTVEQFPEHDLEAKFVIDSN
jgi:hypothetical protein